MKKKPIKSLLLGILVSFSMFNCSQEDAQPKSKAADAMASATLSGTYCTSNSYHNYPKQAMNLNLYAVGATVMVYVDPYDVPNRFTIYEGSTNIKSSGWIGYSNNSGPWGMSISKPATYISFVKKAGMTYYLGVETVTPSNQCDSWYSNF